jgi:hypothetical protein
MHDELEPGLLGWSAIEDDLKSAQEFKARIADLPKDGGERASRSAERGRRTRGGAVRTRGEAASSGPKWLRRSSESNQVRYATLQHFEANLPPQLDHGILMGLASQIVETELDRLLATPALAIAPSLIEALKQKKKDREPAEILESWAAKEKWTALGIESIILLALRRGCDQGIPAVREFLETHFLPDYEALVRSKPLGQCLDQIRTQRNAIVHKGALFDAVGYEGFIRQVVGHRRFALWAQHGPEPAPPAADAAILHHHLEYSRIAVATEAAVGGPPAVGAKPARDDPRVAELVALKPQGQSLLDVRVTPLHAGTPRTVRGLTVSAHGADPRFLLGDRVRFRFQNNRPCHVVLIDVGTTGGTSILWPNAWHPDSWLDEAGDHFLPDLERPECDFTLSGQAGSERVLAVASLTPLPVPLVPEPGASFRSLTTGDVARLVEVLKKEPSGWALSVCSFQVEQA